jgi:hypothetical protein
MKTYLFEARGSINWGKFLVADLDEEWEWPSIAFPDVKSVLDGCGWDPMKPMFWIMDLQTGEGAYFKVGGAANQDLEKHRIWVCPMFEPWLEWFYKQDMSNIASLPRVLHLPDAPAAIYGYRRQGPAEANAGSW